jgi:cbb3-type cytochrome oxidase maturation protein
MNIIFVLLPIALLMGGGFLAGFVWMVRQGQYEDLVTPAYRILIEGEDQEREKNP